MKKLSILILLVLFSTLFISCWDEPAEPTGEKTLADTLIGEWRLIRIAGGMDGIDKEPDYEVTLKISSRNGDTSFHYEIFQDTDEEKYFYFINTEGDFVVMDEMPHYYDNYKNTDYKFIQPSINLMSLLRVYELNNQFFIGLDGRPLDGYCFTFLKINGE